MNNEELLTKLVPQESLQIKPVYDIANNLVHYQTDPFLQDGKIIVKRIASYPVEVQQIYQVVEEYVVTENNPK